MPVVFDPPQEPVNVRRMMIYSLIPILNIYAAWRVQSFWAIAGLSYVITLGVAVVVIIPLPLFGIDEYVEETIKGVFGIMLISVMFGSHLVFQRYFSMDYNNKLEEATSAEVE